MSDKFTFNKTKGDDSEKVLLHSMIKKYFSNELLLELTKLSMIHDVDNNSKGVAVNQILTAYGLPFRAIGSGTNRYAILIEDYIFKIALDEDGKIDNKREFMYTKLVQPYAIKVYECMETGLIITCEYYEVFTEDDFMNSKNQIEMRRILKELSKTFLIGDIGISKKNYTNWGYRQTDGCIGILDFAYIYKLSYKAFMCTCKDRGMLYYDADYNNLICPMCGSKHTFWEVRRRISSKQEKEEIGDIKQKGYVVNKEWSEVPLDKRFTESKEKKKKPKKEPIVEKQEKFDPDEMFVKMMRGDE